MLHYRNTYKNCKVMLLYCVFSILFLLLDFVGFAFSFIPEFKIVGIVTCIISSSLFVIFFFLLAMKNNDYKLKNYFKLSVFNKEFKEFEKLCEGNKKRIKEIKRQQRDHFLQFGEFVLSNKIMIEPTNKWNDWVEDTVAFSYPNSKYMEKISYLTYILYNACASGGGLEEFFRWLSYEPFTCDELIDIITKNEFFSSAFKDFLTKIIKEYDKEKQDELFERYELVDKKIFFTFENQLFDCANWLAYNRKLLSSCVGLCLHGNIDLNMYKLFLSKDYKKVIYIYSIDDKLFKVIFMVWNEFESCWIPTNEANKSIYDSVETALNDIKEELKDFIEIKI